MKRFFSYGVGFLVLFSANYASSTVLTFEDLYGGIEERWQYYAPYNSSSYGGFEWSTSLGVMTKYFRLGSGYEFGTIGTTSIFNWAQADLTMSSPTPFTFDGAYITAAWNTNETVTVEGWRAGTLAYTTDIVTSYTGPYWFNFNYADIDSVVFRTLPLNGTNDNLLQGNGSHIAIDNVTYNSASVPEPSTLLLLGSGLAGIGFWGRKKFFNS